jgi:hypothetical protein
MRASGAFAEENGCLVLRSADGSRVLTPVFVKGSAALVTDGQDWLGLYIHESPVAMGPVYRLSGAAVSPDDGLALETPIPSGCPSGYFVVQSVGRTLADADDLHSFCTRTILCASFKVD